MEQIRLLNVAQIRYSFNGTEHEYRPNCVEITVDRDNHRTLIVMLALVGELDDDVDPIFVGRIILPEAATIVDAVRSDGSCWTISTSAFTISVRPYKEECIFVDPSYGRIDLPNALAKLYGILRASKGALIAHGRLLNSTPETYAGIRLTHEQAIASIKASIVGIESKIKAKENEHDRHTEPDHSRS